MKLSKMNIKDATRHLLREKPVRDKFDAFKTNLLDLLDKIKDLEKLTKQESEEHLKNDIRDFLLNTYYKGSNLVNTNYKKDLVVYLDNTVNSNVGVVIEAKRPKSTEMISLENANKKAMHEIILYYMDERMKISPNNEIKKLIITNIYEWYIIDANEFDKHIYGDFKKLYELTKRDKKDNEFFYEEARKKLENFTYEFPCVKFDLTEYRDKLQSNNKSSEVELVALYKIFSPNFLLKARVANDSNSLDTQFYTELLHIIGLTETDESGKKVIQRKKEGSRNSGSIIEDTIIQLDSLDKISRLEKPDLFGNNYQERLFNVALELCITWVNRILFLKLLESQIISYQNPEQTPLPFQFLNSTKIRSYDQLNVLFFQVLAIKNGERNIDLKKSFEKVPYLNSSLFEPSEIEQTTIFISNLQGDKQIPVLSSTKLLNEVGKKETGSLDTLDYLFRFLNAYDFSTDSGEEVQEINRTLMNASVLGLIFEKINGYKDGAVFTPSFVTMFMCRETIRRTVVQKFNEAKKWNCKSFEDLQEKIIYTDKEVRKEANNIINSIKMCDPSVGSGHYLVSALNEMLSIKYDLKVMQYRNSNERIIDHSFTILDDELIVTNLETGNRFKYNPINPNSQRIQETLFHEKQTIIEKCLFGVDINPNSVKICRLRLWIELLKNAYYKSPTELETLPNIDINIKCGNSLVSRFSIDADLSIALKKSKYSIDSYRDAVDTYRNATSKEEKREMERLITLIKSDFRSEISKNDPKVKKLYKLSGELLFLTNQTSLFEKTKKEKAEWNKKVKLLSEEIDKLEKEIEEIKGNKIYENAFEWRFEFPEVLNEKGDFLGFDIVFGNPPYIRHEEIKYLKPQLEKDFKVFNNSADILTYFFELGYNILKRESRLSFIVSNKFFKASYGENLRLFLTENTNIEQVVDFDKYNVFDEATVKSAIIGVKKEKVSGTFNYIDILEKPDDLSRIIAENGKLFNQEQFNSTQWIFQSDENWNIYKKISEHGTALSKWDIKINRGLLTGLNEAFLIDEETKERLIKENKSASKLIKPLFRGRETEKYYSKSSPSYIIATFPSLKLDIEDYPSIKKHLLSFGQDKLAQTGKEGARKKTSNKWFETQDATAYWAEFEKPKLFWKRIGSKLRFCYDESETYTLDSTCIATGKHLKYLVGVLNSKLIENELNRFAPKTGTGDLIISVQALAPLQIPIPNEEVENKINNLVDKIISAKKLNKSTVEFEAEIDEVVYKLYDLTEEEKKIVKAF